MLETRNRGTPKDPPRYCDLFRTSGDIVKVSRCVGEWGVVEGKKGDEHESGGETDRGILSHE